MCSGDRSDRNIGKPKQQNFWVSWPGLISRNWRWVIACFSSMAWLALTLWVLAPILWVFAAGMSKTAGDALTGNERCEILPLYDRPRLQPKLQKWGTHVCMHGQCTMAPAKILPHTKWHLCLRPNKGYSKRPFTLLHNMECFASRETNRKPPLYRSGWAQIWSIFRIDPLQAGLKHLLMTFPEPPTGLHLSLRWRERRERKARSMVFAMRWMTWPVTQPCWTVKRDARIVILVARSYLIRAYAYGHDDDCMSVRKSEFTQFGNTRAFERLQMLHVMQQVTTGAANTAF